jgi:hypothetical protein
MLPLIGTADQVVLLGYVIDQCPACGTTGPLGVYETKKKITVYFIPTVPYQKNQMIECKTCHSRFIVPDDMRESLGKRLISQEALSEQIRQMRAGLGGPNGMGAGQTGRGPIPGGVGAGQKRRTLYQTLQVDPDADPEVIEAAFKRLAMKYHPDRSSDPDAPARMREILEARDVLGDDRKRRAYDASLGIMRPPPQAPRPQRGLATRPEDV